MRAIEDNKAWKLKSMLQWKPIVYYFWEEFSEKYMKLRKEKNVSLKSLRFTLNNFDTDRHKNYRWYLKEVKHVMINWIIQFDWVFLWDNKVACFDIKNYICYFSEDIKIFEEYRDIFNIYWNE